MNWIANEQVTDHVLHEQCVEGLVFSKHDLDAALLQHSELFYRCGEMVAKYSSVRDEAKKRMEESYAKNSLRIREECVQEGRKVTEDLVKQLTLLDDDYKEDCTTYLRAKWEADVWDALKDAYSSRGFMIKEMAELWKASYFNTETVAGGTEDVTYDIQRSKMAVERTKVSFKDTLAARRLNNQKV